MSWLDDWRLLAFIGGLVTQAGIIWWRTGVVDTRLGELEDKVANNGERISRIEGRLNGGQK